MEAAFARGAALGEARDSEQPFRLVSYGRAGRRKAHAIGEGGDQETRSKGSRFRSDRSRPRTTPASTTVITRERGHSHGPSGETMVADGSRSLDLHCEATGSQLIGRTGQIVD